METIAIYILFSLGSYLLGGVPFGLILGKVNGIDVRLQGSGNIGATNVGRCCGKSWGIFCFVLDFCKGAIPVIVALLAAKHFDGLNKNALGILAAVGTVCGHCFCPYLRFKGGKGIATSAGALSMLAPYGVLFAVIIWALTLAVWRYVGLSSVCAAAALPIGAYLLKRTTSARPAPDTPIIIMLACIGVLAIYRHKSNIKRLLNGTEPKIGQSKAESEHHENSGA